MVEKGNIPFADDLFRITDLAGIDSSLHKREKYLLSAGFSSKFFTIAFQPGNRTDRLLRGNNKLHNIR